MPIEEVVFFGYRGLAAIVALVMALVVLRSYDWRQKIYAAMIFVPFALRAVGFK